MAASVHPLRKTGNGESVGRAATPGMSSADAAYHTVHSYPGGAAALAPRMLPRPNARGELTPVSANTLQHKVNPNCNTHHLFLSEAREVMALSNDFSVLHALASELGHIALAVNVDADGMTMDKVMGMTKEFGDLLSAVSQSTAKNSARGKSLSPNEMSRIEREAGELMGAINALVGNMRRLMGERGE